MTAVAPPPNIHSVPRPWSGQHSLDSDVYVPRSKSSQKYSMPSSASSTTSVETDSGNSIGWGSLGGKKKPSARGPTAPGTSFTGGSSISNGWGHSRPSMAGSAGSTHQSTPVNGVHQNGPVLPSQHIQQQPGGQSPPPSYLMLLPLNGTFERKQIPLPFFPDTLRIGRQTNAKTLPTPTNGYFDSKVLSRQHAEVWAEKSTGKVWIRDIKSSNGTFVNGQRLSQENQESEPHSLQAEDVLELGIDIVGEDNKTIVHHKVAARVEHAGTHTAASSFDLNFGDVDSFVSSPLMGSQGNVTGTTNGSMRGRTGSQGARGTMTNGNAAPSHRPPQVMLPAITLEMVVKKLNGELQCAKQQSSQLQRTAEIFDALMASPQKRPHEPRHIETRPTHTLHQVNGLPDSRSPFVPLQSLPTTELSRVGSPDIGALFSELGPNGKASKFDKPSHSSDKPAPPQQLLSLVDALAKARKETEAKAARVHDLEEALKRERRAREDAEDRAAQLESASRAMKGRSREILLRELELEKKRAEDVKLAETKAQNGSTTGDGKATSPGLDATAQAVAEAAALHQKRMDEMAKELQEVTAKMSAYKVRAETAEKERNADRKTLAEMVQAIRKKEEEKSRRSKEHSIQTDEVDIKNTGVQAAADDVRAKTPSRPNGIVPPPGGTVAKGSLVLSRSEALPYASALSVMILGVGIMAVLNGWQRGGDR